MLLAAVLYRNVLLVNVSMRIAWFSLYVVYVGTLVVVSRRSSMTKSINQLLIYSTYVSLDRQQLLNSVLSTA